MIKSQQVKVFRETLHCDECEEAPELVFVNMMLTSNPPQYPFQCPLCRKRVHKKTTYPKIKGTNQLIEV
ncbi:hypothetical protein OZL92_17295 [Bacillus sonorensis]|uniref:Uncharacterized protein n=2 Tax=Bacillus sonorensis TaxID=119858 RepID=M5NYH6_9BACI|nr:MULTISPECIES: hypothetical protein [Bacillus]ASB89261.1 hypothetical protein S101395_02754 [Bacillus sonorensis]EME72228.1 hypothetical protein BSONL12_23060 [Bacillus sonorensis L12]MCZ0075447.1 hypothetical protein [Bacillus sonorensis]MCZ0093101.1 hypothetical protein [Bacillus sonorensis]MDI3411800.1 hypothetical protein [Bacillus sonorensis]